MKIPTDYWSYPKMTPTADGKGLLMSFNAGIFKNKNTKYGKTNPSYVYGFHCASPNECFWEKKEYELKSITYGNQFLTVPSSLVEDC